MYVHVHANVGSVEIDQAKLCLEGVRKNGKNEPLVFSFASQTLSSCEHLQKV